MMVDVEASAFVLRLAITGYFIVMYIVKLYYCNSELQV